MAVDFSVNSEVVCSNSSRLLSVNSLSLETMAQCISNLEGNVECSMVPSFQDSKTWKFLKPAERTKFKSLPRDKARKLRDCGKPEGAGVGPTNTSQSTMQCVGTTDVRDEGYGLYSLPVKISYPEISRAGDPQFEDTSSESALSTIDTKYHILAVDDNKIDQKVIERLLKSASYQVTTVNSALRALEYLGLSESCASPVMPDRTAVHLIMTDYCMPEMTGYEFLKIIKAETSAFKDIPVILMSSENDSNRIERCIAEGAEEFIIKPVQVKDIQRLQGHIRSSAPSSGFSVAPNSLICGKRKSPDDLKPNIPGKRPRCDGVAVA